MPVEAGVDEIALAFTADAYSRTYKSRAVTIAAVTRGSPLTTRRGIRLVPDRVVKDARTSLVLPPVTDHHPTHALDAALDGIAARYGPRTAGLVALQLEYQRASPR